MSRVNLKIKENKNYIKPILFVVNSQAHPCQNNTTVVEFIKMATSKVHNLLAGSWHTV